MARSWEVPRFWRMTPKLGGIYIVQTYEKSGAIGNGKLRNEQSEWPIYALPTLD